MSDNGKKYYCSCRTASKVDKNGARYGKHDQLVETEACEEGICKLCGYYATLSSTNFVKNDEGNELGSDLEDCYELHGFRILS